jgi:hypothetical protein
VLYAERQLHLNLVVCIALLAIKGLKIISSYRLVSDTARSARLLNPLFIAYIENVNKVSLAKR